MSVVAISEVEGEVLGDGFWCDAKPRVFGHPDALIIVLPDLESLKPISELY
jgi:hypothetical protein